MAKIIHIRSLTPGSIPTTSSLGVGEIAINVPDGKAFLRQSGSQGDTIQSFVTTNSTTSGSINILGNTTLTGSLNITGSTTQIGNNNLFGNTTLSGSIIISGSTITPTVQVYGNVTHDGYIRFSPVSTNIDTSISASYIYVSGSTNDLYFSQNGAGYSNTTRLRWLEGNLYTGLLHGGLITTQSSTVFQVSSGSGIIVNLNASQNDNPYPTIQYLNWNTLSSSIAPFSASADQSFVSINSSGQIYIQPTPYDDGDYNTLIPIGNVIHQNRSTINATATYPSVAYGWKQRSSDFIRAFGPLKLSGLDVAVSSSAGVNSTGSLTITSGTSFSDGRNYTVNANNPSYINDTGTTVSKIFRYYQSGSDGWVYLTNTGAGFGTIDPTQYSNNGTLTTLTGTGANREWTIQRVYWFPGGATKGIYVYYGNAFYASKADAIANINIEPFVEAPNTKAGAVLSGYLIVRNNANFTDSTSYQIVPSGLFRNVGGSGGGGSVITQTLTGLSDVLITGPTNGQPLVYDNSISRWVNASAITASLHGNADTATTASYVQIAQTASYVLNAVSSSFANTASFAPDYVLNSVTASMLQSYVLTSVTSSMTVLSSSFASTASFATGYLLIAATSSMLTPYVLTSSTASMTVALANTASYVTASNVYGPFGPNSILSASFALSASWAPGGTGAGFPFIGNAEITGSLSVLGSGSFTEALIIDATFTSASSVTTGLGTSTVSVGPLGYQSLFSKYVVRNGSNLRAGEFMMVWTGTTVSYTDTSTSDIGDTSALEFTGSIVSSAPTITTAPGAGWTVKMLTTYL